MSIAWLVSTIIGRLSSLSQSVFAASMFVMVADDVVLGGGGGLLSRAATVAVVAAGGGATKLSTLDVGVASGSVAATTRDNAAFAGRISVSGNCCGCSGVPRGDGVTEPQSMSEPEERRLSSSTLVQYFEIETKNEQLLR